MRLIDNDKVNIYLNKSQLDCFIAIDFTHKEHRLASLALSVNLMIHMHTYTHMIVDVVSNAPCVDVTP